MIRTLSNVFQPMAKSLQFSTNHAFTWRHNERGGRKREIKGESLFEIRLWCPPSYISFITFNQMTFRIEAPSPLWTSLSLYFSLTSRFGGIFEWLRCFVEEVIWNGFQFVDKCRICIKRTGILKIAAATQREREGAMHITIVYGKRNFRRKLVS